MSKTNRVNTKKILADEKPSNLGSRVSAAPRPTQSITSKKVVKFDKDRLEAPFKKQPTM